jgi:hypothetical protein
MMTESTMAHADDTRRENDRLGLVALIEGAELRRRLEAAERVIEAVLVADPFPRIKSDSTINGIEHWCDDCCDDFTFRCHTSVDEPVDHTDDCPGMAVANAISEYRALARPEPEQEGE